MTTMIAEIYDALVAAGSPEEKARAAAEAIAGQEVLQERFGRLEERFARVEVDLSELKRDVGDLRQRVSIVERDLLLMKWMLGFVLAFQLAILIKLLLH
ncbi:MAG TPA: hypothetical protein VGR91_16170 [Stellaceae bacterium]|nr:hypothetical protein [Stellaceae bacterium]